MIFIDRIIEPSSSKYFLSVGSTVDDEPVLEVKQSCNDWKICQTGINLQCLTLKGLQPWILRFFGFPLM